MKSSLTAEAASRSGLTRRACVLGLSSGPLIGTLATPPAQAVAADPRVQLASDWQPGRSPQGFLVSEKFDGVRAVWDGKVLRFRSGRPISAPEAFLRVLPAQALDGELWLERGKFDRLSSVVRQAQPDEAAWARLSYWVFDAPALTGDFQSRSQALEALLQAVAAPQLRWVEQYRLDDALALQRRLDSVVEAGGEGLMLHRADASWRAGRTQALFKFKPEPDEEAQVLGYLPGQGRHEGLTGALLVQTPAGIRFALGSGLSDAMRREPPALGSWVSYRYRGHTPGGVPRFATVLRIRPAE